MCRVKQVLIAAILAVIFSISASAQSQGSQEHQSPCADDPNQISADRPGIADGSTVIGAKTFQVESGIQEEFRRSGNDREHTFFVPTLLRLGVDSGWELRIEGNTFTRVTTFDSANTTNHTSGFAPVSLGLKYQIHDWNIKRELSLGTIVRVFPAWGSKEFRAQHTTGDIRLAADWKFAPCLSLNPNIGVGRFEDDQGRPFTALLFATTLNYQPNKKLNPFVDIGIQAPESKNGQAAAILDTGIAYIIGRNLQVDAEFGTRVHGETAARPFVGFGISWKTKSPHLNK